MRKFFLKSITLLFLLLLSINAAWAGSIGELAQRLDLDQQTMQALASKIYCAKLTGKSSSTGGGMVYVNAPAFPENSTTDPRGNDYVEGVSNVAVNGMGISMSEMSRIGINAWAKSDDGYYFAGFSYANMGTDLGLSSGDDAPFGLYANTYVIGAQQGETIDYVIYGTFEPIRITEYSIDGNNTTSGRVCLQTVNFTFSGNSEEISIDDFDALSITSSKGGGSWTNESGNPFSISDLQVDGNNASVTIKFTATDDVAKEYSANLQLKTKAKENIAINVPLNARTAVAGAEALRLNSKKVQYAANGSGTLTEMMNQAVEGDIIQLNGDYASSVTISKNITFDLNGYTLSKALTTSGSNVVLAYSPYGGTISETVTVTGGKLTMNGGTIDGNVTVKSGAKLVQNGATIQGAVENNGTMTTTNGVHNSTLTTKGVLEVNGGSFTPANGAAIDVKSGKADIMKGTINCADVAIKSAGTTTIYKLAEFLYDGTYLSVSGGKTTVNCGKFVTMSSDYFTTSGAGELVFKSGYFKSSNDEDSFLEKHVWRNTSGVENREGYEYFAGDEAASKAANVSVCHIGGTSYPSLEEALAYVNNAPDKDAKVTIIMDNDYTLPAGYYTLPENAVLIVPNSNTQGSENPIVERIDNLSLSEFRVLTFADGVNLDVHGTIEVSGKQLSKLSAKTGSAAGEYGRLQMNKGSRMTLQNGAILRAWGFVTGDIEHQNEQHDVPMGEIDARRGSTVYELFQMGDWGNTIENAKGLVSGDSRFPINSYFIQNIEVPTKYHPGSHLITVTSVSASVFDMSANDINIIGVDSETEPAMFKMNAAADAENTWVRKWYDASKDQQVYEINSGAHIGSLLIRLASSPFLPMASNLVSSLASTQVTLPENLIMNSGQYVLPITYNFKLHLLNGTMDFTQNTALLPGSELEIDKEATVSITKKEGVLAGSLYIYDKDDWPNTPGKLNYSPVFKGVPTTRAALDDAIVNVHGTFDTDQGYVFTTDKGGNIFSSVEDAGTFLFTQAALANYSTENVKVTPDATVTFKSALLRNSKEYATNGGSEYVATAGASAGQSFCFIDFDGTGGQWKSLTNEDCFVKDENDIYYAKPRDYVALASKEPNADHTYSDAAGKGRLFILTYDKDDNCQWLEVEAEKNYYHCIDNDTYYEWKNNKWQEVRLTITWNDWDGSEITTYKVPYGTQAEWLSSNPKREKTVDYTYTFTGWSPELAKVTSDVVYTATYQEDTIKYTIIFEANGGMEIERHLLPRDSMPVCENEPTQPGYILQWEPALESVVGNQTYTATWLPEPPETYTITFKNYNGTILKQKSNSSEDAIFEVEANAMPTDANVISPTKEIAGSEYNYEFAGWKPALAPATTNAVYVAQFTEARKTYTISYFKEDGTTPISSETLEQGATPTPPAVEKENPEEGKTYTYVWQNIADANKTIETVTGDASYKPVFTATTNKYTVTLKSNIPNACTFSGAGIYDHGKEITISASPVAPYNDPAQYDFVWSDNVTNLIRSTHVKGDITLTAMFKKKNLEDETVSSSVSYTSEKNVDDFIITSDGSSTSGEITAGWDNLHIYGNADFKLQKHMDARHWYDIAVPWRVDAANGIFLNGSTTPAVLGTDIEVFYYDGAIRAKEGKVDACWVSVKNQSKKVLEPGRAYLFLLYKTSVSSVTFRKKVQEPLLTTSTSVEQYNYQTGNANDRGWNGIANPALFKAFLNAGTEVAQTINANGNGYEPFIIENTKLVVGQPVYVQTEAPKSPVVANSNSYASAPARRSANNYRPTRYEVIVSAEGANIHADRLIIRLDESKEEETYVIGKDLAKFGTGSTVAQMWINRYDTRLCVNTVAPEGDVASFPMSVYAPKTGDYTIAIENESNAADYALYLTKNGEAIANLSDGAYTLSLNKGTTDKYGLRIGARVPQVATDLDAAIVDADGKATKVLYHGQVFIIRGEKVYTVDGQLVK